MHSIWVNSSLMPKGVEHACMSPVLSVDLPVNSSLMPKGVEHWAGMYAICSTDAL